MTTAGVALVQSIISMLLFRSLEAVEALALAERVNSGNSTATPRLSLGQVYHCRDDQAYCQFDTVTWSCAAREAGPQGSTSWTDMLALGHPAWRTNSSCAAVAEGLDRSDALYIKNCNIADKWCKRLLVMAPTADYCVQTWGGETAVDQVCGDGNGDSSSSGRATCCVVTANHPETCAQPRFENSRFCADFVDEANWDRYLALLESAVGEDPNACLDNPDAGGSLFFCYMKAYVANNYLNEIKGYRQQGLRYKEANDIFYNSNMMSRAFSAYSAAIRERV